MSSASIITPAYWPIACEILAEQDPVLAPLALRYRGESLTRTSSPFAALCAAVAGQQISVKAADSLRKKLEHRCGGAPDPYTVRRIEDAGLRACGFSASKSATLLRLADMFIDERAEDILREACADEARDLLVSVKGIGPWTADMYLIFRELHPDIFPVGDIGVLNAVDNAYGAEQFRDLNGKRDKKSYIAFAEQWAPYRTVAVWLLWRALDPIPVQY